MKAVYIKEFGGAENLEIREIPDPPRLRDNEILVRVHAAGLNRADLLQRKGLYPGPEGYDPHRPGLEFAGEIVETGERVKGFKSGDRVMAITSGEAQAEFVLIDAALLMKIPGELPFIEAATIPEAYITAHDAVFAQGELKSSETLLIHAVGSGVGIAGLQLAKAAGAKVVGTSRTAEKLDRCQELGLDRGVVVEADILFADKIKRVTDGKGADVILDLVGASYFKENLASLAMKGRIILVGLTGGSTSEFDLRIALQKRAKIIGTVLRSRSQEEKSDATRRFVEDAMKHFKSSVIKPVVDKVFDTADVRAAHEYLESNESFGKVVLEF